MDSATSFRVTKARLIAFLLTVVSLNSADCSSLLDKVEEVIREFEDSPPEDYPSIGEKHGLSEKTINMAMQMKRLAADEARFINTTEFAQQFYILFITQIFIEMKERERGQLNHFQLAAKKARETKHCAGLLAVILEMPLGPKRKN